MKSSATIAFFLLFVSLSLAQQNKKFQPGCTLPVALAGIPRTAIDNTCGIKGASTVPSKIAESKAKNNFCAAAPAVNITYDTLKELQDAVGTNDPALGNRAKPPRPSHDYTVTAGSFHEGQLVRLAAFVHLAKYSNTSRRKDGSGGENVNCNRPGKPPNDLHIVLVPAQNKVEAESVTAEASPHFRPPEWTDDNLNHFHDHLFRFTGQLFLDTSHKACGPGSSKGCAPKRISVWEVHPVYAIEICESTDASTCEANGTDGWESLEEFLATENEPDA
jgi:hypothetical protein